MSSVQGVALLPVSAVVPTLDRAPVLMRMLQSLAAQSAQPKQIIIVDASAGEDTRELVRADRRVKSWLALPHFANTVFWRTRAYAHP